MKSVFKLIDFFIPPLFLTNLWIIIYTKLNDYFYFRFAPTSKIAFYRSGLGNPEPFEIPLYIILSVFFVGLIWLYYKFHHGIKISFIIKFLIFLFLLLLFLSKLGTFPLADDLSYPLIFFVFISFVILVTLETFIMQKIIQQRKILSVITYAFVAILIAVFTFEAHFRFSPPDAAMFYGPIWEATTGKTIFTNFPSQYGFLAIFLFSSIHVLTGINFVYVPIIALILNVIEYFICFYLILKISESTPFAFLGLFSLITINYLSGTFGPQAGPLRWSPIFVLLYLFYKFKRLDSKLLLVILPLLSFWVTDSGIALVFGYFFTLFLFFLAKRITIKQLLKTVSTLFTTFVITTVTIQTIHLILGMQLINFFNLFESIRRNAVIALLMVPIEDQTYFWLVMLIYFASVIYFMKEQKAKNGIEPSLILLSANLMLFASIYYVGRSMPHELFSISPFFLLTTFLLTGSFFPLIKSNKIRLALLTGVLFLFIIFPTYKRMGYISEKLLHKTQDLKRGAIFSSETDQFLTSTYKDVGTFINNNIKENEIIILSPDDTYLFYLSKKRNLLNVNPIYGGVDMDDDTKLAIQRAILNCPSKIVIDCSIVGKCAPYKSFSSGQTYALPIIQHEIEKKCNFTYQPTICTNQLCIAVATKAQ